MVSKTDVQNNPGDTAKLAGAGALTVLSLIAFYLFPDQSFLFRVLGLLVAAAVVVFLVYQTALGKRIVAFFRDARTEVRKVVWPSRAETTQTTLVVVLIVIVVGIFLWLFDMILAGLFRMITGI